jgi:hypothetical protein
LSESRGKIYNYLDEEEEESALQIEGTECIKGQELLTDNV